MATNSEAIRLNLEYYRKQAKALLKAVRAGDAGALERLSLYERAAEQPALHTAQLAIAREQGFASWPRFRKFLAGCNMDFAAVVNAFVNAALADVRQARELLAQHEGIAGAGFYPALVLGDAARVQQELKGAPDMARATGGPRNCEPLVYVCFSRLGNRAADMAETARVLLGHGANPNASMPGNEPLSSLYAASGLNNNPALTQLLLEAGANPNDGESLYHSTEHRDLQCMRLLLRHGATVPGSNALKHMLDREDLEGLGLLLDAGADANEVNDRGETALHWAVWRGRSARAIAMLLDRGAAIDAKRNDGRTAYALAVQSGQADIARVLEERDANAEISALDRFVGACAAAAPDELERLLTRPVAVAPGSERLLPDLTTSHRTAAVRALLAAGMPVDAPGEMGGTALHLACWHGYADIVKILLAHGASLAAEDATFHGTPAGWFGHGVQNCGGNGDYAATARVLLEAGAKLAPVDVPTGREDVDAVLREFGVI